MAISKTLAREIAADPTKPDAYLVLADELLAAGDPHGELIVLQSKPRTKAAEKREAALLPAMFGKLWPIAKRRRKQDEDRPPIQVEWFMGFWRSLRVSYDRDDEDTLVVKLLPALLAMPAARFLQHLSIGVVDDENPDYGAIVDVLDRCKPPATITSLFFGDFEEEDWRESWNLMGNFAVLSRRFPALERLRIHATGDNLASPIDLDGIALPELRELELVTNHTQSSRLLAQICGMRAKLERLAISFGHNTLDEAKLADVQPILDGKKLGALHSLHLEWIDFGPALVERLVTSKLAARLTHLALRSAHLHDAHVDLLLANRAKFPKLASIDLGLNYLTKPAQKRAKKLAAKVELDTQWNPREDYLLDE